MTVDRRHDWHESHAVIHGPKEKNARKSACACAKSQTFIYKPASFEEPVSGTRCRYHFALRCFRERGCTSARRTGCNARKFPRKAIRKAVIRDNFGVDHRGVTNLSAPIWFTGRRHCTVFRHVMQFSLLVLCKKSTLTVILPQIKKKRNTFQTLATGVPKLKT